MQCTLLVLVNSCLVLSEFWTWRFVLKTLIFWQKLVQKTLFFWLNNFTFDQQYLHTGLKTQNGKIFCLDLIFTDNFCQNIKSFSKQNFMLRIHSKPTEFTQKRTEIDKNFQCEWHNKEATEKFADVTIATIVFCY